MWIDSNALESDLVFLVSEDFFFFGRRGRGNSDFGTVIRSVSSLESWCLIWILSGFPFRSCLDEFVWVMIEFNVSIAIIMRL